MGLRGLKTNDNIDNLLLDVGNSGTTIRLNDGYTCRTIILRSTIIGDESIGKRPMKRVTDPLRHNGSNNNWKR